MIQRNTIVFTDALYDQALDSSSHAVVARPVTTTRGALLLAARLGSDAEKDEVVVPFGAGGLVLGAAVSGTIPATSASVPVDAVRVVGDSFRLLLATDKRGGGPPEAFDRQIRAFGADGQRLLARMRVGVVGAGGTGSAVCEQLLRLGIGELLVIDPDVINDDGSNVTRVWGSTLADIGTPKVDIVARTASSIGFATKVTAVQGTVVDEATARLLTDCDIVFGCTDDNRGRLTLSRLAVWYLVPIIDMGVKLTSDQGALSRIEGRVTIIGPETGCLQCRGRVDPRAAHAESLAPKERTARVDEGYAVGLDERNPAVITYTTAVAATAVSELLARTFSLDPNPPSNELLLRFHHRDVRRNTRGGRPGHWCTDQANIAAGDALPFLGTLWTS